MPAKREQQVQMGLCNHLRSRHEGVIFASDFAAGISLPKSLAILQNRFKSGKGYPDIFIAARRDKFAGLFIELKAEGVPLYLRDGSISKVEHIQTQATVLAQLRNEGYCAEFAVGLEQACALVDWYLGGADGELLIERSADGIMRYRNTKTGEVF